MNTLQKYNLKKVIFGKTNRNTQAEIILAATIVSPELDVTEDTSFRHYHCKLGFVSPKCGAACSEQVALKKSENIFLRKSLY